MSRSPLFRKLARTIATANFCEKNHIDSSDDVSVLKSEMLYRRLPGAEVLN